MLEEITFLGKELQLIDIPSTATIDPHNLVVGFDRKGVIVTSISTAFRSGSVTVHDLNGVNVAASPHSNLCHYSASRGEVIE